MSQKFNLKMAKQEGERIAKKFGGNALPVDLLAIADKHSITIKPKNDSKRGVSGMLLRHGDSFGIAYSTNIKNEGFQRFSIAHELGHYFLDGHLDHILPNGNSIHVSCAEFVSSDSYEREADYFASGLLMPDDLVQLIIQKNLPGFSTIKKIAETCRTSLISSAIKYANLSEDAVAIIVSENGKVDFCFLSQTMKSLPEFLWPAKHSSVPDNSLTAKINKKINQLSKTEHEENEIDIIDWLGGNKSFPIKEEALRLGSYNKTLTVLSYSGDIEEAINPEEDKLFDSWTPRL